MLDHQSTQEQLRGLLRRVHIKILANWCMLIDAGALDDSHGAEDWTLSDEAIDEAVVAINKLICNPSDVTRFEVIDETGRAYVKGPMYGSPVKIELSYQDNGRTLKVFVEPRDQAEQLKIPNPGSDEALDRGCRCPVLDNGHGDEELGRTRGFWINGGCPLHDKSEG